MLNQKGTPFKTIVIDPPWKFIGGGNRNPDQHYDAMKLKDIIPLCKDTLDNYNIEDNAHCYIWCINMHIDKALDLMKELGFEYKTNIAWVKNSFGLGYYFRGQHELCLFGVKGKGSQVRTGHKNVSSVIKAKKRKHSQKPDEFYDLVENITPKDFTPYTIAGPDWAGKVATFTVIAPNTIQVVSPEYGNFVLQEGKVILGDIELGSPKGWWDPMKGQIK